MKNKHIAIALFCFFAFWCSEVGCFDKKQLLILLDHYKMEMTPILDDAQDANDPSKEEQQLHDQLDKVVASLYENIVKITALYYFQNIHGQHEVNHFLLAAISTDIKKLLKVLVLYIPKLFQNKDLSWSERLKKLSSALAVLGIVYMWSNRYLQKPIDVLQAVVTTENLFISEQAQNS